MSQLLGACWVFISVALALACGFYCVGALKASNYAEACFFLLCIRELTDSIRRVQV